MTLPSQDFRNEVSTQTRATFLEFANHFADSSRNIIDDICRAGLSTTTKADKSLVTQADIQIEQAFRDEIHRVFPEHGVIGEEFGIVKPEAPFRWIIDPIDGTEEFVNGVPTFGSIIGLHYKAAPLIGVMDHPALNIRLSGAWQQGVAYNNHSLQRYEDSPKSSLDLRIGISKKKNFSRHKDENAVFDRIVTTFPNIRVLDTCYSFTQATLGALDVVVEYNLRIWDLCAAQVFIPEVGGEFTIVSERDSGKGMPYVCAVFGKPWAVERVLPLLENT